ncbi:FG-GAP repeat domain-containing protein [Pontibacter silvestris]|uniref:FG-GAP repeat domain-containing protein n=1 Tax=Pontibacter silvestris TaxID=2305183 RepID=UPI001E58183F|nr:VCBS repeat-containing protein [Pontibacter silvestris]
MHDENIGIIDKSLPDTSEAVHLSGKALAQVYCKACHAFPDPGLLDKATWQKNVLPQMGLRLGLGTTNLNPLLGRTTKEVYELLSAGIYPQEPYISTTDWQKIEDYYIQNAPEKLALPETPEVISGLENYSVVVPALNKGRSSVTTLVKYLPDAKELWVGDMRNWLFRLNPQLQVADSMVVDTPPVDIVKYKQAYKVLTIGSIIPSDKGLGHLHESPGKAASVYMEPLLADLRRPVNVVEADLNQDELQDLIICNFGYNLGSLVWYQNKSNGKYQPNILKNLPGAIKAEVTDLNGDGLPDIVAMFAQGTETIMVFYNRGEGSFTEENLVQFPPVYGLSYFELADFNKDGAPDLLITNGDNADYSSIVKPYHGVRIYLNNGNNKFREKYFYPMPGATKAVARDFDKDGELDIAAIAYFPDYDNALESGFVYLQQNSNFTFRASTFSNSWLGRWFTLESCDYDQDGDEDIILGAFTNALTPVPPALQVQWNKSSPSVVVLQNTRTIKKLLPEQASEMIVNY